MKCGERIVRCLTGGDVDRIPFGVGLGWHPWGGAIECWRQESGNPSLDPAKAMISKGLYVPMFDHLIPPDAKWENFKYAAEKIKVLCRSKK
jgi:hypothetical protein